MFKYILLLLLFPIFFWFGYVWAITNQSQPEPEITINEDSLFSIVNEWKLQNDGYKYEKDYALCGYADQRLKEIQNYFSHDGFHKTSSDFLSNYEFKKIGENLAEDVSSENNILVSWLESPTHRENLDDNYTKSCIKCEKSYCVHIFGM